ncbi:MAG: hypothetical protein ACEPOZ_07535, partial [Marinifilaceae bacterium]
MLLYSIVADHIEASTSTCCCLPAKGTVPQPHLLETDATPTTAKALAIGNSKGVGGLMGLNPTAPRGLQWAEEAGRCPVP